MNSPRAEVARRSAELQAQRARQGREAGEPALQQIEAEPELLEFAVAEGSGVRATIARPATAPGGQGAKGYPNLTDDVWLWGGTLDDIQQTITVGVRSGERHAQSRCRPSASDAILKPAQIDDSTEYVRRFAAVRRRGRGRRAPRKLFADNCAACHGPDGKGNRTFGAPNLTDTEWLYGSDRETSTTRSGTAMAASCRPGAELDAETIKALAIYVQHLAAASRM